MTAELLQALAVPAIIAAAALYLVAGVVRRARASRGDGCGGSCCGK